MPMTENELADLDTLLLRLEKKAKAWTWGRWMIVVMGLLLLGLAAWALTMQVPHAWRAGMQKDVGTHVGAFELLWARNSAVYICLSLGAVVFYGALGGILLTSSLCRWRKGRNDLLLVKMARAWLESQQADPPSAP